MYTFIILLLRKPYESSRPSRMPKVSQREQLLRDLDRIVFYSAVLEDDEDPPEDEMAEILDIRAGVLSCRYLIPRQPGPRITEFYDRICEMRDDQFRLQTRMDKRTFAMLVQLIEHSSQR